MRVDDCKSNERLFAANRARKAELQRCLRDKMLWGDQIVSIACTALKVLPLLYGVSLAYQHYGLQVPEARILALLSIIPAVLHNPRNILWKNCFAERTKAAFDAALKGKD